MADNNTKIILTAEDRTASALSAVKGNLQGISQSAELASRALGAIGVSFTGAAMVAMVKGTIDAADGFNDLAQRVGISIRELAGWTLAANQSGTSMETVAKGVKGLSVYMVEHGERLRAAGITATDANGAMMELADLFKAMPDPVQRTALAVQLFGKAGMDMLPMLLQGSAGLKDAQEKADAYGKKMAELAPQADEFNDLLQELGLHSKALGINITEFMLPGLIGMAKWLNDIASGGVKAQQALAWMIGDRNVATLVMMGHPGLTGGAPREVSGKIGGQGKAGPTLADEEALAAGNMAGLRGWMARGEPGLEKPASAKTQGPIDVFGSRSFITRDKDFAASIRASYEFENWAQGQLAKEMQAIDDKAKAMDEAHTARMEAARIESEGEEAIRLSLEKTSREMAKQKDMANDLGMTFASAFEDAIIGGRGLQSILQGLAQDVARIFIRKTATEPLANALSGKFKDWNIGDIFGGARASGGPVSSGQAYLVGERGPELFMPGASGSIIPNGGAMGGITVNLIEDSSRAGQVRQGSSGGAPVLDVFVEQIRGMIAADISRGNGPVPAALAGTYGLNRAAGAY